MHNYFIKTPWLVKKIFSSYVWSIDTLENAVFLTFDDGPHPTITPWVLNELNKHDAKATFFCIGKNVDLFPEVYQQIITNGHAIGNHTYNHMNGWKVNSKEYMYDIYKASLVIKSSLFRPPYGRIKKRHAIEMNSTLKSNHSKIIMWDVLSADFDKSISKYVCLENIIKNITKGSIVVFHDSEKAFPHLEYILPKTLNYLKSEGYQCLRID